MAMNEVLIFIAQFGVAIFAGAAVYISLVEQPARMHSPSAHAIEQFRISLPRAERMQPPLLIACLIALTLLYSRSQQFGLLLAMIPLLLVIPLSIGLILPINRRLAVGKVSDHVEDGMKLIARWGQLHCLRSLLAAAGLAGTFATTLGVNT
jgi:hypothetical protein